MDFIIYISYFSVVCGLLLAGLKTDTVIGMKQLRLILLNKKNKSNEIIMNDIRQADYFL